jgi:hypothetical protein
MGQLDRVTMVDKHQEGEKAEDDKNERSITMQN